MPLIAIALQLQSCGGCAFKCMLLSIICSYSIHGMLFAVQWQKSPGKYMKKEGKLTIEDGTFSVNIH